jgi:hypothetical protein
VRASRRWPPVDVESINGINWPESLLHDMIAWGIECRRRSIITRLEVQ